MSALFSDTHPKMEALQIQFIRRMPAWKKISMVDNLNETVRMLAISGIKQRHPEASPAQIHRMLAVKRANPQADTSELERQIDLLVYELYGLIESEIKIIEGG